MGWASFSSIFSRFGQRIGNVAILRRGRECADSGRIRGCGNNVEESHVGDIVEVDLFFENHGQAPSVKAHGKNGGAKGKFADN